MKNSKIPKTNAMRILDGAAIPYDVVTYDVDLEHLDAVHMATEAGLPIDRVFKTIVMINDEKKLFVFCVPGAAEISLKKAREISNSKSIDLLKLEDLQKMTGYVRGGCSPLGMIRPYPTYIDEYAQLYDYVYVSGGLRGVQLKLNPMDLAKCCNAEFVSLTVM